MKKIGVKVKSESENPEPVIEAPMSSSPKNGEQSGAKQKPQTKKTYEN